MGEYLKKLFGAGVSPLPEQLSLPPPPHPSQGFMQALAEMQAQSPFQNQYPRPKPVISMNVRELKLRTQVDACVRLLPTRIAVRIVHIEFFNNAYGWVRDYVTAEQVPTRRVINARFVITFDNQKTLEFEDVDAFPSDEHIARIALECP